MDDLVELAALQAAIQCGDMDRLTFPQNCLDVMAQFMIGLCINENIDIDESLPQHEEFSVMTNLSCPRCESQVEVLKKRDAFD